MINYGATNGPRKSFWPDRVFLGYIQSIVLFTFVWCSHTKNNLLECPPGLTDLAHGSSKELSCNGDFQGLHSMFAQCICAQCRRIYIMHMVIICSWIKTLKALINIIRIQDNKIHVKFNWRDISDGVYLTNGHLQLPHHNKPRILNIAISWVRIRFKYENRFKFKASLAVHQVCRNQLVNVNRSIFVVVCKYLAFHPSPFIFHRTFGNWVQKQGREKLCRQINVYWSGSWIKVRIRFRKDERPPSMWMWHVGTGRSIRPNLVSNSLRSWFGDYRYQ